MLKRIFPILAVTSLSIFCSSSFAQSASTGVVEVNDEVISVSGQGHHRDFPCNGRRLEIMGSDHVITTSGVCSSVEVSGSMNTVDVTIAPAGTLMVEGSEHTVRWRSSGIIKQDVSGSDNKIVHVKD